MVIATTQVVGKLGWHVGGFLKNVVKTLMKPCLNPDEVRQER